MYVDCWLHLQTSFAQDKPDARGLSIDGRVGKLVHGMGCGSVHTYLPAPAWLAAHDVGQANTSLHDAPQLVVSTPFYSNFALFNHRLSTEYRTTCCFSNSNFCQRHLQASGRSAIPK